MIAGNLSVLVDSDQSQNNTNEQLGELINSLCILLKSLLNEEDDEYLKKLPIVILETISFLMSKMDFDAPYTERVSCCVVNNSPYTCVCFCQDF